MHSDRLIVLASEFPVLDDQQHLEFKDSGLKDNIWRGIDTYDRKKLIVKETERGQGATNKMEWKHM